MMRWLKEKKKEKRSSSVGCDEDSKEDDYGFEKEKPASKSPVTKRQLPPTPLTPEEKSPHIYEEIHDVQVASLLPENGKASPQKHKKHKHGFAASAHASSTAAAASSVASSSTSSKYIRDGNLVACKDDSISPYMVVPVDEEVRQTPTDFHRDGTPEVHCDVIVKDTHCEILLSRKPKVSAFRLDSTGGGESNTNSTSSSIPAIRNNTHFCSRNRRASVDVHSAGGKSGGSSSGAWNSSAFSSSSTSRVNSVGTSMMSLSTLSERHPGIDDNGSSGSSAKGVMTYSAASNFIPRATKLAFNPLKPIDGDDTSLSNQDPFFSMMPPPSDQNVSNPITSPSSQDNADSPVVYSPIPNPNPNHNNFPIPNSSQPHSRPLIDPANPKPNFNDPASCHPIRGYPSDKPFHSIIRPTSPSSSSCTYASVSFPTEPKVYNTIAPDLISQETTRELQSHTVIRHLESSVEGESETESVRYSSIQDTPFANPQCDNATSVQFVVDDSVYSGVLPFRMSGNSNTSVFCTGMHHFPNCGPNHNSVGKNLNQVLHINGCADEDDSASIMYSGVVNPCEANSNNTVYACIENADVDQSNLLDNINNNSNNANVNSNDSHDTSEADVDRILYGQAANSLVLDFCTCSEDHHSNACGFMVDCKQDDDTSSIATTINEPRGSCTGCGRLIKQITYSESYSDETYEHVYSSRLLVRKGRRFSSPDITLSEISNCEGNDGFDNVKSQESFRPLSRDDSWTARNDDVNTFYRPMMDSGLKEGLSNLFPNVNELKQSGLAQPDCTSETKPVVCGMSRQSFPTYGSNSNDLSSAPDRKAAIALLANHRASLPATIPSNLIPVHHHTSPSSCAASQLQPKTNAFSNLLSKFARPKSKHSSKIDTQPADNLKQPTKLDDSNGNINSSNETDPLPDQIPEKNTTKLSKFFQRLSANDSEVTEGMKSRDKRRDENSKLKGLQVEIPDNAMKIPKLLRSPLETKSDNLNHKDCPPFKCVNNNNNNSNLSPGNLGKENSNLRSEENTVTVCQNVSPDNNRPPNRILGNSSLSNEPTVDKLLNSTECAMASVVDQGVSGSDPNAKPQNKTDSGDTCYEYDISTSSESEQTGYDYFLSKVKKSLNLEQEVQQIADMNALRKKMFCKKCKKNGVYSAPENEDYESYGSDAGCPHLLAKYGDLRKIFGDFVVDQRAAILDCLTNYAHGPFNVKCEGRDNHCRECGCEIMTSDSESMTTVYSILSQQFRMTSPGTHTPSCDSDDGTMADNSCESADEEDNDVSSGYDEAVGPVCDYSSHKVKKREKSREKKERRSHHTGGNISNKDVEKSRKKSSSHAMHLSKRHHYDHPEPQCIRSDDTCHGHLPDKQGSVHSTHILNSDVAPSTVVKMEESNLSTANTLGHLNNDNSISSKHDWDYNKHDDIGNKPKPILLATEKVIQDIYAPLPSKALSWLTARNYEPRSGGSCSCARSQQSSSSKLIHGGDLDNETNVPPTASTDNANARRSCRMSSYPYAGHPCDNGVNPVQTCCQCSLIKEQTNSSPARCIEEHDKRSGHLNHDKLSSVNEVDKLEFNSVHCRFECSIDESSRIATELPCSSFSSENALRKNEKSSQYSKHVENVCKEQKHSTEMNPNASGRVGTAATFDVKHGPGCEKKDRLNKEINNIIETNSDLQQTAAVELDVSQFKKQELMTSRQKQKQLQMAALDLLPETVLGSDTDVASECGKPEVKAKSQRLKSNMVERLARMFEDNSSPTSKENKNGLDHDIYESINYPVWKDDSNNNNNNVIANPYTMPSCNDNDNNLNKSINVEATTTKATSIDNSMTSSKFNTTAFKPGNIATTTTTTTTNTSTTSNKNPEVTKFNDNSSNNINVRPYISTISSPFTATTTTTDQTAPASLTVVGVNQGQKHGGYSHAGSIVKGPPPTTADHPVSTAYQGRSSQNKNNDEEGKSLDLNTNHLETSSKLSGILKSHVPCAKSKSDKRTETKHETKEDSVVRTKTSKEIQRNERRAESRLRKTIISPSLSSSSGSSSKRKGHTRQKKLSKRSNLHKRARSKSERRRGHHEAKEERTVYYFSSDLSDIDVIEVEDWETYSSGCTRENNSKSVKKSREIGGKTEVAARRYETDGKSTPAENSSVEQGEECVIQEIYSIPPSSSEIREAAAAAARTEGGSPSPQQQMTPDAAKMNKSKKTDIYKTKKSNNKLLSDLIIRNYDRQMYEVGSNV